MTLLNAQKANFKSSYWPPVLVLALTLVGPVMACNPSESWYCHPFYLGITGGGGSTTWGTLVPPKSKQMEAMSVSTPIKVKEGGGIWGFFAGFEPIPYFGIEAAYTHFPRARVEFDEMSYFSYEHDDLRYFNTQTESASLMAKFMFFIPHTRVRAFSGIGPAALHRKDCIRDKWRLTAAFNAGVNYAFTPHWMGEIAFNYTAGYGLSEISPAEDFIPFTYSAFIRLAYRFL